MNNIKKTGLGMLVAVLAFGFSAFSTIKKRAVVVYYKTNMSYPNITDPRGYYYYSGDRCEPVGSVCSAQWNIGSNSIPVTDGQSLPPNGISFITGSVVTGHFE